MTSLVKETSACYAERIGVQALLEDLALHILRDRPEDASIYLSTLLASRSRAYLNENVPKNFGAITTQWLSHLTGSVVESFESTILGNGAMSDAAIIRPVYQLGAESGPSSFVLKYAKDSEEGRAVAKASEMYRTEVNFYDQLRDEVHPFLPCPRGMGQFKDPKDPDTYFCIAMEDLSVEYESLNGVSGLGFVEATIMLRQVAAMHAHFWDKPVCKQPWLNRTDKDGCTTPFWFDSWYDAYMTWTDGPKEVSLKWCKALKEVVQVDMREGELVSLYELMEEHPQAMRTAIHAKLNSRPKTLVHGDLRADNLLQGKKNKRALIAVDWQAALCCSPGVEFIELLMGSLEPLEGFDDLDTLYDTYLSKLYEVRPQAEQEYTKSMLNEDFALGGAMWLMALGCTLYCICSGNPDHPVWKIMGPMYKRFKKCLLATNAPALCRSLAKDSGIL